MSTRFDLGFIKSIQVHQPRREGEVKRKPETPGGREKNEEGKFAKIDRMCAFVVVVKIQTNTDKKETLFSLSETVIF